MFRKDIRLPEGLLFPEVLAPQTVVGLVGTKPSRDVIAVDLEGKTLWSRHLNEPCQMGVVRNDRVWLFESQAIVALDLDGHGVRHIQPRLEQDERVGSIAATENAIMVSLYREKPHAKHGLCPRVLRLSLDGDENWSQRLPMSRIAYQGCVHMGVSTNWGIREMPQWEPSTWLPFDEDDLLLSSDRILASFQEMPRSGIGCRYVLDANSGELLWKSKASPIAKAHALVGGRFLMGDQGYGAFETTLYEDKVENLVAWPSHGYVIEMEDRLISIQMSNDLSVPQYVVGLGEGGKVSQLSQRLGGYYTSTPQLMADGNIYFWRADTVWAWNPKEGLRSVFHAGFGEGSFASSLKFDEDRLAFNIRRAYGHSHNQRMFVVLSL